ncbi:hypothetical protein [Planktothricoides raciborskii]|uniref:hypothetical protein n=1 Tax=Planktothricoides raciborskii TaxID=132608 RepID=UPI0016821997|nr:hypothetical protein [Planktothricoides raciborskii]
MNYSLPLTRRTQRKLIYLLCVLCVFVVNQIFSKEAIAFLEIDGRSPMSSQSKIFHIFFT